MKKYNLLVVAHPDDETIFAGGLLQVYRRRPWRVICVTDGNADGQGAKRRQDFAKACGELKVKDFEMWDFPDVFEKRLSLERLTDRLKAETPSEVFTHNALGEYGHPHHQDVSLAVHRVFSATHPVWSFSYNSYPEKNFRLPNRAFQKKIKILSEVYFSETKDFARLLPASFVEGVQRTELAEAEAIHRYLAGAEPLDKKALKTFAWFEPYFESFRLDIRNRRF